MCVCVCVCVCLCVRARSRVCNQCVRVVDHCLNHKGQHVQREGSQVCLHGAYPNTPFRAGQTGYEWIGICQPCLPVHE